MVSTSQKPATAARIYDYLLGGIHNFPADQQAAKQLLVQLPDLTIAAQANRGFLHRSVRHVAAAGVRQFLDLGSGIPTQGNVHEIAQQVDPDARVVYVDIDPVAVSESLEILDGNRHATAIQADIRDVPAILKHPGTRGLLDFAQPVAVLAVALLHFVPDDAQAYGLIEQFVDVLAPGSHLILSHATADALPDSTEQGEAAQAVYRQQTTSSATVRTHAQVERFFAGLELVDPGVVWASEWRPEPGEPDPTGGDPRRSTIWAGVAKK